MFDLRCAGHGIGHRFTRINQPWTNGQVERMNRTIKEATACDFGRRFERVRGITLYGFICEAWAIKPQRFTVNPHHQMPGPST
jgi:transposase InsO family protein